MLVAIESQRMLSSRGATSVPLSGAATSPVIRDYQHFAPLELRLFFSPVLRIFLDSKLLQPILQSPKC